MSDVGDFNMLMIRSFDLLFLQGDRGPSAVVGSSVSTVSELRVASKTGAIVGGGSTETTFNELKGSCTQSSSDAESEEKLRLSPPTLDRHCHDDRSVSPGEKVPPAAATDEEDPRTSKKAFYWVHLDKQHCRLRPSIPTFRARVHAVVLLDAT